MRHGHWILLGMLTVLVGEAFSFSFVVAASQTSGFNPGGIGPTYGELNISRPANTGYEVGDSGHNITWELDAWGSVYYYDYKIFKDGAQITSGTVHWDDEVTINVDGLPIGRYIYKIEVSGDGKTITDEVAVTVVASVREGRALVVGINDYPGSDSDLGMCVGDANAVKDMLINQGFSADCIDTLTNSQATSANIQAKITEIGQEIDSDEVFAFFYSGHGGHAYNNSASYSCSISTDHPYSNNYLNYWTINHPGAYAIRVKFSNFNVEDGYDFAYVTDPSVYGYSYTGNCGTFWSGWIEGDTVRVYLDTDYIYNAYGFDVLTYEVTTSYANESSLITSNFDPLFGSTLDDWLDTSITCATQHIFIDACESGGLLDSFSLPHANRAVMTACNSTEYSWESSPPDHGWFTNFLIQSYAKSGSQYLRDSNHDGVVSIQEMYDYVNASTIAYAQSRIPPKMQQPQLSNQISGTGAWDFDTGDNDGLFDWEEVHAGSSTTLSDTDSDTISDYNEVKVYNTDPAKKDTDDDGLDDYTEIFTAHTDPNDADTDNDGFADGMDWAPLDPLQPWGTFGLLIFAACTTLISVGYVKYKKAHPVQRYQPRFSSYSPSSIPAYQASTPAAYARPYGAQPTYQGLDADQWGLLAAKLYAQGRQQEAVVAMTISKTLREAPEKLGVNVPRAPISPPSTTYSPAPLQDPTPMKALPAPATPPPTVTTTLPAPATSSVMAATPVVNEDWFATGRSFFKLGQLEQAEQAFQQLLQKEPHNPEAWFYLGLVLQGKKQDSGASQAFQSASANGIDEPKAWADLGFLLTSVNRKDEAQSVFELALQLAPSDWSSRVRVMNALAMLSPPAPQAPVTTLEPQSPAWEPTPAPPAEALTPIPEVPAPEIPPEVTPREEPPVPTPAPAVTPPPATNVVDDLGSWGPAEIIREPSSPQPPPLKPIPQSEPRMPASPLAREIPLPAPSPPTSREGPIKICELCNGIVRDGVCEKCGGVVCPHCKEMNFARNVSCAYCDKPL